MNSIDPITRIKDLEDKITDLNKILNQAQNQITDLMYLTSKLKISIQKYEKQIKHLKE